LTEDGADSSISLENSQYADEVTHVGIRLRMTSVADGNVPIVTCLPVAIPGAELFGINQGLFQMFQPIAVRLPR